MSSTTSRGPPGRVSSPRCAGPASRFRGCRRPLRGAGRRITCSCRGWRRRWRPRARRWCWSSMTCTCWAGRRCWTGLTTCCGTQGRDCAWWCPRGWIRCCRCTATGWPASWLRSGPVTWRSASPKAGLVLAQHGITLPADSLECLTRRTEGWAAGIRLAALSMGTHPDPGQFVRELAAEDSALTGYLVEEVLNAQPPEARELLLSTSILEQVSAEAASELAGHEQAGRILADLARENAFVQPLGGGRYRYHTLFGEVLRLKLRLEQPGHEAACAASCPLVRTERPAGRRGAARGAGRRLAARRPHGHRRAGHRRDHAAAGRPVPEQPVPPHAARPRLDRAAAVPGPGRGRVVCWPAGVVGRGAGCRGRHPRAPAGRSGVCGPAGCRDDRPGRGSPHRGAGRSGGRR